MREFYRWEQGIAALQPLPRDARGRSGWPSARPCGPNSRRATSCRCRWRGRLRPLRRRRRSTRSCGRIGLVYGAGHVAAGAPASSSAGSNASSARGEVELLGLRHRARARPGRAAGGAAGLDGAAAPAVAAALAGGEVRGLDAEAAGRARSRRRSTRTASSATARRRCERMARPRRRDAGAARARRVRGRPPPRPRLAGDARALRLAARRPVLCARCATTGRLPGDAAGAAAAARPGLAALLVRQPGGRARAAVPAPVAGLCGLVRGRRGRGAARRGAAGAAHWGRACEQLLALHRTQAPRRRGRSSAGVQSPDWVLG